MSNGEGGDMEYGRSSDGYGEQQAEPTGGGGAYAPTPTPESTKTYRTTRRPAATYGAPAAATTATYYEKDAGQRRRFPWVILLILCILAVLFVIGITKYGYKDTVPGQYTAPTTTVYVAPTTTVPPPIVVAPLPRTG
jgi:hypothetical protein